MAFLRPLILLATVLVLPIATAAQAAPTCSESATRATSGVPSGDDLAVLLTCESERGPAYASYLTRLGSVRDTTRLRGPFADAALLHDGMVFEALYAIARNPAATTPARVYSLIALIYHEAGSTGLGYREITSVPEGRACAIGGVDGIERSIIHGAPLPADHQQRSRVLARRLESDLATPSEVRSAARCLLTAARSSEDEIVRLDTQPVNWAGVELGYVCNDLFRARNSNLRDVPVDFDVEGTSRRAKLVLPRNPYRQGGYSEITFAVPRSGAVRFLFNGAVIKKAINGGTRCP